MWALCRTPLAASVSSQAALVASEPERVAPSSSGAAAEPEGGAVMAAQPSAMPPDSAVVAPASTLQPAASFLMSPQLEIPRQGVSLRGLERFLSDIGAPISTEGLSTSKVSQRVLDITFGSLTSYCDQHAGDAALTGPATVFISHSWAMSFNSLISVVRNVLERDGGFVWLDLLSNNQHTASDKDFVWWANVFRSNVRSIGHTVLVLEFDDPKPLHRAWCLWEIACSVLEDLSPAGGKSAATKGSVGFEIMMPPSSRAGFELALLSDFGSLLQRTCSVDVAHAEAFHGGECRQLPDGCPIERAGGQCPNDKALIMDAVAKSPGGTDRINERIAGTMRAWMAESGAAALQLLPPGDERLLSSLQSQFLKLLLVLGRAAEAEAGLLALVEASRRVRGPDHVATLQALAVLCTAYLNQMRYDETAELLEPVLATQLRLLGPDHPDVAATRMPLAMVYFYTKRPVSCQEQLEAVVASAERRCAAGDAAAIATPARVFLCTLAARRGDREAALRYCATAHEIFSKVLGEQHPSTHMSEVLCHCFAVLIPAVLDGTANEMVFDASLRLLRGLRIRLGATHNLLFSSIYLTGAIMRAGLPDVALSLARETVEGYENSAHSTGQNVVRNHGQALKMLSLLLPPGSPEQRDAEARAREKLTPFFRHKHVLQWRECVSRDERLPWLGLCDACRWTEFARPYLSCDECGVDICVDCVAWFKADPAATAV